MNYYVVATVLYGAIEIYWIFMYSSSIYFFFFSFCWCVKHMQHHYVVVEWIMYCMKIQFRLFEVIETYTKYYLIMEHAAAGELFKRLISEGRMHESEAKNIFAQIVLAVKHLVNNCIKFACVFFLSYCGYMYIFISICLAWPQHRPQRHQSGKHILKL